MTFQKQLRRILLSTSYVMLFIVCMFAFMVLIFTFVNRSAAASLYTPFSSFDSSNLNGEITRLNGLIDKTIELMNYVKDDQTKYLSYQKQLNLYYYYKDVLNFCLSNNINISSIGDFRYLFSQDKIALTDGIYNGYNYLLVFSSVVVLLSSGGINIVNSLLITYERECGMFNVMLSNTTEHHKLFKWKHCSSIISSSILVVSLLILFFSLTGAFSYYYPYISFKFVSGGIVISTWLFLLLICLTMIINIAIYWLFSVSISYRNKNVLMNIVLGVILYIAINAFDTFLLNPFIMSSLTYVYCYLAFKFVLLAGAILTFTFNQKALTKIDF